MPEQDWNSLLDQLHVAGGHEQTAHRATLVGLLNGIADRPDVAAVALYGSLARGGGDQYSDIDLTVVARPGRWAALWESRNELVAGAGRPVLILEHQWAPVADGEVCFAAMLPGGMYIDLVIRRTDAPPKAGEVMLFRAAPVSMPAGLAAEPVPPIQPHRLDDTFALFWLGSLLCAKYIARGDAWGALDFVESRRRLLLKAWWLVHTPTPAEEPPARATAELPLPVRRRLATAVPQLGLRQLATALWAVASLMQEIGPQLAASGGREYPVAGAAAVMQTVRALFEPLHLIPPEAANAPSVDAGSPVSLREVGKENVRAITRLDVAYDQRHVVAPNAVSLAEALVFQEHAWYRAIYAADTPVGFVMLYENPAEGEYFLWRLMVDARYQAFGYGRRAIELLIEYVRSRPGATKLGVSYHKGPGGPEGFYCKLGFVETGEVDHGEHVAVLTL